MSKLQEMMKDIMVKEAWHAVIHVVTKSQTPLRKLNNPYFWCFLSGIFIWWLHLHFDHFSLLYSVESNLSTYCSSNHIYHNGLNKVCLTVLASVVNIFFSRRMWKDQNKIYFCLFWMQIIEFICFWVIVHIILIQFYLIFFGLTKKIIL